MIAGLSTYPHDTLFWYRGWLQDWVPTLMTHCFGTEGDCRIEYLPSWHMFWYRGWLQDWVPTLRTHCFGRGWLQDWVPTLMTHCFGTEGDCRIEYLPSWHIVLVEGDCRIEYLPSWHIVLVQRVIAGLSTYPHDTLFWYRGWLQDWVPTLMTHCFGTEGDCRIEYLPSGHIVLVEGDCRTVPTLRTHCFGTEGDCRIEYLPSGPH